MDFKEKVSEDILNICNVYTDKLQHKQEKSTQIPNCFILPFIFGDKTGYFSDNLLKKIKDRYGESIYYDIENIYDGDSNENFKSKLVSHIESIKSNMAKGIYSNKSSIYTPVVIMLSSELTKNINIYLNHIITSVKDEFNLSLDIYLIVDKYSDNIRDNIKAVLNNIEDYKKIEHLILDNIYFLGESSFIVSENSLDIAVDTLEANIYYKVIGKLNYNWNFALEYIEKEKEAYSGEALESFDCNWLALSYIKFDFAKYSILYYLKGFITSQLGEDEQLEKGILEGVGNKYISELDKKIDQYLERVYPKEKLKRQIKNVPIVSNQIENIRIPKKSLFNIFKKNKQNDYAYRDIERRVFGNRDYIIDYIELNKVSDIEEFNLMDEIGTFNIISNLDEILNSLKSIASKNLNELTSQLSTERGFVNRTDSLSSFMNQYINRFFRFKLDIYVLNKKIELLDLEIEKIQMKKHEDFNKLKGDKKILLSIIDNLMNNITFNNRNLRNMVDNILKQQDKYKISKFISWNKTLNEIIDIIGQDKFLELISETLNSISREDMDKLGFEFKNIMDDSINHNKYCIKTKRGFISGEKRCKPPVILNTNPIYLDYFESIMCYSTSDIKCE